MYGALLRISCIQARMWPERKVGVLFEHCLKEMKSGKNEKWKMKPIQSKVGVLFEHCRTEILTNQYPSIITI
jgi:hypothetical protein